MAYRQPDDYAGAGCLQRDQVAFASRHAAEGRLEGTSAGLMTQQMMIATVLPRTIAAVRQHLNMGDVPKAFKPALDKVWAYLRSHPGLRTDGHNILLYHHVANPAEGMNVDFGVEVTRQFQGGGEVACVETPGGEAAILIHRGPYSSLPLAHAALHQACAASGRKIGSHSWEIYGDWTDDPTQLETEIVYLLA